MRRRLRSACRGDHPEALTLLTWPYLAVRITERGPVSFIQVGSGARIQRRCHLIVSFCSNKHMKNGSEQDRDNLLAVPILPGTHD
jgi:hypothetical protein